MYPKLSSEQVGETYKETRNVSTNLFAVYFGIIFMKLVLNKSIQQGLPAISPLVRQEINGKKSHGVPNFLL